MHGPKCRAWGRRGTASPHSYPHVLGISCKPRQALAAFLGAELGHFCPGELDVGAGRELGEVELEVRGIVAVLDFVPELLLGLARFLDELALAHARERLGELARALVAASGRLGERLGD